MDNVKLLYETKIVWEHSGDGEFPYRTHFQEHALVIRVNDFPDEPLYTLFVDGKEAEDLEDWPTSWVRPAMPKGLLADILEKRRLDTLSTDQGN